MGYHLADEERHQPCEDCHEEGEDVDECPPPELTAKTEGYRYEGYCQNQCQKGKEDFS